MQFQIDELTQPNLTNGAVRALLIDKERHRPEDSLSEKLWCILANENWSRQCYYEGPEGPRGRDYDEDVPMLPASLVQPLLPLALDPETPLEVWGELALRSILAHPEVTPDCPFWERAASYDVVDSIAPTLLATGQYDKCRAIYSTGPSIFSDLTVVDWEQYDQILRGTERDPREHPVCLRDVTLDTIHPELLEVLRSASWVEEFKMARVTRECPRLSIALIRMGRYRFRYQASIWTGLTSEQVAQWRAAGLDEVAPGWDELFCPTIESVLALRDHPGFDQDKIERLKWRGLKDYHVQWWCRRYLDGEEDLWIQDALALRAYWSFGLQAHMLMYAPYRVDKDGYYLFYTPNVEDRQLTHFRRQNVLVAAESSTSLSVSPTMIRALVLPLREEWNFSSRQKSARSVRD